jgi:hypothetical protein
VCTPSVPTRTASFLEVKRVGSSIATKDVGSCKIIPVNKRPEMDSITYEELTTSLHLHILVKYFINNQNYIIISRQKLDTNKTLELCAKCGAQVATVASRKKIKLKGNIDYHQFSQMFGATRDRTCNSRTHMNHACHLNPLCQPDLVLESQCQATQIQRGQTLCF